MHRSIACCLLALCALLFVPSAHAQVTRIECPPKLLARPERCRAYQAKRELVAAEKAARAARQAELEAYRRAHRTRVSVVAQLDGFLLGMGDINVTSALSLTSGVSLQRFVNERLLGRLELLGRIGGGRIDSWNVENLGAISDHTGLLGGMELHTELLVHPDAFYMGPALSVGWLHMSERTLHEEDYRGYDEGSDPDVVHIPHDAAYLAAGVAVGFAARTDSGVAVGIRALGGVWNELRHLYLQLALNVAVRVWD
jgi:hypothetical protein